MRVFKNVRTLSVSCSAFFPKDEKGRQFARVKIFFRFSTFTQVLQNNPARGWGSKPSWSSQIREPRS